MKLKLILFISLFFTVKSFSQAYEPFNLGNTRWKFLEYNFGPRFSYFYFFSKDTTGYYYNNKKYFPVKYTTSHLYTSTPYDTFYLHDDTLLRQVTVIDPITDSIFMMYDFSANTGDTIKNIFNYSFENTKDIAIIDSINYITINGISRKHLYLHSILKSWIGSKIWIEGIGNTESLFLPSEKLVCPTWVLVCHEFDGNINYGNQKICDSLMPTSTKIYEKNNFSILPNPSETGIFKINTTEKITWKVLNLDGKIISEGNQNDIDISKKASGIYILQIMAADKIQTIKLQKL